MAQGQTLGIHSSWPCCRPDALDTLLEFCFSSSFAIFLISFKVSYFGLSLLRSLPVLLGFFFLSAKLVPHCFIPDI